MSDDKKKGYLSKLYAGRPFLIVLFVSVEIFIVLYFLNDYRRHDILYTKQMIQSLGSVYRGATAAYNYTTQIIFDDVVNRPEVLKLIALALDDKGQRDACREELYRLMLPSYEKQKNIGIWQFHFHLKDGTSFLRMHSPKKYGDNLFRRPGVKHVNTEQKRIIGYEIGHFADGYRYMYPLFFNGRHLGSVEFSITSQGIIEFMDHVTAGEYYFMVNRATLDEMMYEDWKKMNFRISGLSEQFMIGTKDARDTSVAAINQRLRNRISSRLARMEQFVEKERVNDKDYLIVFLPVEDMNGKPVAYFVHYIRDESSGHYFRITIIDISLFTIFLAAIFYSLDNIQSKRMSLEQKNVELEHATNALQQYKLLSQHARDIILFIWSDGRIMEANEAAERAYGCSREELLSLRITDLRGKDTLYAIEEQMNRANERGLLFETVHRRRDGSPFPVEVSSIGVDIGSGRVLMSIIRDITQRKKAEDALKESEEKYRILIETIPDVTWISDNNGHTTFISPNLEKVYGYKPEQVYSSGDSLWIGRIHPDDVRRVKVAYDALFKGKSFDIEYRIRRKDGEWMWLHDRAIKTYEEDGTEYAYGIFSDITLRRKAEDALRESEEIFRSFMEYSPIYVFFKDENIRSIRLSRNYESMLGRSIDELLGKSMDELFPSELAKSMVADDMRIMKEGKTITVEEEFNGRVYSTIKFPINIDGKPRYLAGYTIDITDRRRDEDQIKKALTEKETLLREIHHRVKNNMQVITSLLNLQAQKIKDKNLKKPFEESEQRIKAMALVHERLYQKEDLSGINFSEYIHAIIKELKVAYRIDGSKVATRINVADILLEIDSAIPCGLIINELITNCYKYAFPDDRSGEVIINFIKEDGMYNLTIRDNGAGLPAGFDYRRTDTLGMQIVNVLTKQLLGTFRLRSYGGTEAIIVFKKKELIDGRKEDTDS